MNCNYANYFVLETDDISCQDVSFLIRHDNKHTFITRNEKQPVFMSVRFVEVILRDDYCLSVG